MNGSFENLLKPGQIGNMKLKNRMVFVAVSTNFAGPRGEVTQRMIEYYRRRAQGGAGLITVEASYIMNDGGVGRSVSNQLGIYKDTYIPELSELVDAVHDAGAKISIQPFHAGRQANYHSPVSISEIPCGYYKTPVRKLSMNELEEIEDAFAESCLMAKKAGFDAVQLHFANGYLACQSLSPKFNNRTDMYGGSFENRLRFCLNIIKKARVKVGPDFTLYCRMPTQEFVDGGLDVGEAKLIAKEFQKAGLAAIDLSNGIRESVIYTIPPAAVKRGFAKDFSQEIKSELNIPVIIAGRINNPQLAEEILAQGKSDYVGLGRALIADPDFPKKVLEGRVKEIRQCIACNCGCRNRLMNGLHIRCSFNPIAGREIDYKEEVPSLKGNKKNVTVVGGGPAGLECALLLAKRGHHITMFEKNKFFGGEQLKMAMVPPHKEEINNIVNYYKSETSKFKNLKIITGKKATERLILSNSPDIVIIATGARPIVPSIPGSERGIQAWDVLKGNGKIGKFVVIVGGNVLGCETAEWLATKNHKVTVIEMANQIGPGIDTATKYDLVRRLLNLGVTFMTERKVVEVTSNGVVCAKNDWEKISVEADTVIFAIGSIPENDLANSLKGKVREIYTIGDAKETKGILNAIDEGYRIARNI